MNENETYYYPENLDTKSALLKYWTNRDLGVCAGLLFLSMVLFIFGRIWLCFFAVIIYGFLSMRINYQYSVIKLITLYMRYLFIDELIIKWR